MRKHAFEILQFFRKQADQSVLLVRAKILKEWATNVSHMSYETLQRKLDDLVRCKYLVKVEKIVDGRLAVFYGLNTPFRDWWLKNLRELEERAERIDSLKGEKKVEALKELISFTMFKFFDFVPWFIHFAIQNSKSVPDLKEELENIWNWSLYQYMVVTLGACLRNKEEVSKLNVIKSMNESWKEYLKTDHYKSFRKILKNSWI